MVLKNDSLGRETEENIMDLPILKVFRRELERLRNIDC